MGRSEIRIHFAATCRLSGARVFQHLVGVQVVAEVGEGTALLDDRMGATGSEQQDRQQQAEVRHDGATGGHAAAKRQEWPVHSDR